MKSFILCLALVVGCRPAANPPASAINRESGSPIDGELARWQELDYRSPMRDRWTGEEEMERREFFKSHCENGDPLACRRFYRRIGSARVNIEMYCKAGDDMSCRWHRWWQSLEANLSLAAEDIPYPFALSNADLRKGCAAGLHAECSLLLRSGDVVDVRVGAENNCRFERRDCLVGAESYLRDEPRAPSRARILVELNCQRGDLDSCLWLSIAYRAHVLAEPTPGRGEELHRYSCAHRFERYCADADTKCNERRETLLVPGACDTPGAHTPFRPTTN
jgi:hypothetical protein